MDIKITLLLNIIIKQTKFIYINSEMHTYGILTVLLMYIIILLTYFYRVFFVLFFFKLHILEKFL